jgi:hypothetical protein
MAGIRIGGVAVLNFCSPPVGAYGGSATSGDPQVYRWCSSDDPGDMTAYTDFSGFTDADQVHNPVLSPDKTKILFEVLGASSGYREVWVVDNVPGSTPTQLVADGSNYVIHPSWGADSDTFVYVHCAGGLLQGGTVYKDTVAAPGSPTSLKAATGGRSPFRPQFNFDGSRVAYIFSEDSGSGSGQLRVMDDDGSNDASIDGSLTGVRLNQPPQFSWANSENSIVYDDGASGSNGIYVIQDDGTGKTQINSVGDAAGAASRVSAFAWAPDDSFAVITANLSFGHYDVIRAELDGSDTTQLGSTGGSTANYFQTAIVFENRIWFIERVAAGGYGQLSSMSLSGTGYANHFASNAGPGDLIEAFGGGDGFYYN